LKGIIGITEPRRVAAITLAERVAAEKGDILGGDIVGVRVDLFISKLQTKHLKILIPGQCEIHHKMLGKYQNQVLN
jgi:hypothetical protein